MKVVPCLLLLLFLISSPLRADDKFSEEKIRKFSTSKAWLKINYYKKTFFGYQSQVVDDSFFISNKGKSDPELELRATIRAFKTKDIVKDKQTAQCAYPARYQLIKKEFDPEGTRFKDLNCQRFTSWKETVAANSATLVFPTTFMNNPASMFGHTLLRLNPPDMKESVSMLAYAVNYAAATQGEGALLYATKGVFGGYYGYVSIAPYYERLKKYSDIESRDIWEYDLNFSAQDVAFLLKHLWELRGVPFTYYYFDENCSYQLLALLEAVRPDLDLLGRFKLHVIPVDTLRAVLEQEDMLVSTSFRPSNVSRIKQRVQESPNDTVSATESFVEDKNFPLDNLNQKQRANVYDLSYELLDYKRLKTKGDVSEIEKRQIEILRKRSSLPIALDKNTNKQVNTEKSPHLSHKTSRTSVFSNYEYGRYNAEIALRPAYHDILDPSAGYTRGSGIDFLEVAARFIEDEGFQLSKASILKIDSLSPETKFFKPLSWQFATGFDRRYFERKNDSLEYKTYIGFGKSFATKKMLFSVLPRVNFRLSEHYQDDLDIDAGLYLTALYNFSEDLAIQPEASWLISTLYSSESIFRTSLPLRFSLARNLALMLKAEKVWEADFNYNSFGVGLNFYW